jgi:hypothetical protein
MFLGKRALYPIDDGVWKIDGLEVSSRQGEWSSRSAEALLSSLWTEQATKDYSNAKQQNPKLATGKRDLA